MTKKHFQIIVNAINSAISQGFYDYNNSEKATIEHFFEEWLLGALFTEFQAENERFDKEKFLSALEYEFDYKE